MFEMGDKKTHIFSFQVAKNNKSQKNSYLFERQITKFNYLLSTIRQREGDKTATSGCKMIVFVNFETK